MFMCRSLSKWLIVHTNKDSLILKFATKRQNRTLVYRSGISTDGEANNAEPDLTVGLPQSELPLKLATATQALTVFTACALVEGDMEACNIDRVCSEPR